MVSAMQHGVAWSLPPLEPPSGAVAAGDAQVERVLRAARELGVGAEVLQRVVGKLRRILGDMANQWLTAACDDA